jgi:hypothetical protein
MKVFISWSGETSHAVAQTLRFWLPSVLQYVEPYVPPRTSERVRARARTSPDGWKIPHSGFLALPPIVSGRLRRSYAFSCAPGALST